MNIALTTEKIRGVLGGAADPAPHFSADWEDVDQNGKVTYGHNDGVFNGTTAVDIVPSPGEVTTRKVTHIAIHNADDATATATISHYDGTNSYTLMKSAMPTLETLVYTRESGWQEYTTAGAKVVTTA